MFAVISQFNALYILTIEGDLPPSWGVKPRQQLYKRTLPATGSPYDSHCLPCLNRKADIRYGVALCPGITKRNIVKFNTTADLTQGTATCVLLKLGVELLKDVLGGSKASLDNALNVTQRPNWLT